VSEDRPKGTGAQEARAKDAAFINVNSPPNSPPPWAGPPYTASGDYGLPSFGDAKVQVTVDYGDVTVQNDVSPKFDVSGGTWTCSFANLRSGRAATVSATLFTADGMTPLQISMGKRVTIG
jgi:hypothetical protein